MQQAKFQPVQDMLEGSWRGKGWVLLKDKKVPYLETTEFKLLRKEPCLMFNVQQFTKHAETGNPMHAENGFLKVFATDVEAEFKAQASYSHPFGMNEFEFGMFKDGELVLKASEEHHF